MASELEIEAAARAMKPTHFKTYEKGCTCQNYIAEQAFLNAEKVIKRARKDARVALAAAELVRCEDRHMVEQCAKIAEEVAAETGDCDGEIYIARKIADRIRSLNAITDQ